MQNNDDSKLNFSTFASRMLAQSNFLSRPGDDDSPLFHPEHDDLNDVDTDALGHPSRSPATNTRISRPSRIVSAFSAVANRHHADNNDSDSDNNEQDEDAGNKNNRSGGSELLLGSKFYHDDSATATVDPFVLDNHNKPDSDNQDHNVDDDTDPFIPAPIQTTPDIQNTNTTAPGWKMHQTTTLEQSTNIDSQDPFLTSTSHDPSSSQYPPPPRAHSPLRLESSYYRLDNSDYQQSAPQKFHHVFFRSNNRPPQSSDSIDPRQVPLLSDSGPFPSSFDHSSPSNLSLNRYPRPSIATSLQGHSYHKLRTRDSIFASVFLASSFILILIAAWSSLVPPQLPDLFVLSIPHLTLITFIAFLIGSSYTLLLFLLKAGAAKSTLYLSIAFPPVSLLLVSLYAFSSSWNIQSASIAKGVRWSSCVSFLLSVFLAQSASKNISRVQQTAQVLELACEIILSNPALIILSFALSLVFLIASLLIALLVLTLTHWHPAYSIFVSFHGLWTLAVLRGVYRLIVAGVVGDWFFNRHEPVPSSQDGEQEEGGQRQRQPPQIFREAVARATGPSFGTAVISGILLTLVDTTTFVLAQLFKLKTRVSSSSRLLSTFLFPIFWLISPILFLLEAYIDMFNSYVLIFAGISGDGFWESTRAVSGLIRSSGSQIICERLLVKRILNLVAFVISAVSSLTVFMSLYTQSNSSNNFVPITHKDVPDLIIILIFAGLLPFWMIRLSSDLLTNTTDTLFISYAVDLNAGTTHSAKAVQAFGKPETISPSTNEDELPL